MKNSTSASLLIILTLFSAVSLNDALSDGPREVERWLEALSNKKQPEKMTKLHFYYHDISRGQNATARVVARTNISSPFFFGVSVMADDPVTVGPELMSKRVGYLKGFYGASSFEEVDLFTAMTFVFTDGEIYNGSSLSILGHNPYKHLYREIPVVGGSGRFRLARGVATLKKLFSDPAAGNFTVEVDIVVFHY